MRGRAVRSCLCAALALILEPAACVRLAKPALQPAVLPEAAASEKTGRQNHSLQTARPPLKPAAPPEKAASEKTSRQNNSLEADQPPLKPAGPPKKATSEKAEHESCADQQAASVPENISIFEEAWLSFNQRRENISLDVVKKDREGKILDVISDKHFRVVLGIFSRAGCADKPYRQVIRSTWMQQPSVCPISALGSRQRKDQSCRFFTTFVVGNSGGESTGEEDVSVLPVPETMECGKSLAWFRYAAETYREATHIVKMDMDAFPHLSFIYRQMVEHTGTCDHAYGGRTWTACGPREDKRQSECGCVEDYCPAWYCGHPVGNNFMKYTSKDNTCWSYMQGGFYFMTPHLAAMVTQPGGWWDTEAKKCNPEDLITGHAVWLYANDTGICVDAVALEKKKSMFHPDLPERWREGGYIPWRHGDPFVRDRRARR